MATPGFDSRFAGQVAIVTGGADGIGRAVAERLLLEGCQVALLDINSEKCQTSADEMKKKLSAADQTTAEGDKQRIMTYRVDVTKENDLLAALTDVVRMWGRLDVAVNCAGILGPDGLNIADVTAEGFDLVHKGDYMLSYTVKSRHIAHG